MGLTNTNDIRERLRSYSPERHNQLFNAARYAFGEKWEAKANSRGVTGGCEDFLYYPNLRVRMLPIGQSRRILNNTVLSMSRLLSGDPKPEYPDVDRTTGELRTKIMQKLYEEGEWGAERADVFTDFDELGTGFGQFYFEEHPVSKEPCLKLRYVPVYNVLWSRNARHPGRSNWVAFVHYPSPEDAVAAFPELAAKKEQLTRVAWDHTAGQGHKYIRLTEYYDLGFERGEPTYAIFADMWDARPLKKGKNFCKDEDGVFLPFYFGEYINVPGMDHAIGKVVLQQSTQEALNEWEQRMRLATRRGPVDFIDAELIDEADMLKYDRGDAPVSVKIVKDPTGRPPIVREPGQEVSRTSMEWGAYLGNQYNADSGTSELDRSGNDPEKTATANVIIDTRSQQAQSLSRVQILRADRRLFTVATRMYALGDRHPRRVSLLGYKIPVNDPERPELSASSIFEEPSDVVMDTQAMTMQDVQAEQQSRMSTLSALAPLAQGGAIDIFKLAEEMLLAIGEKDPKSWIRQAAPQGVGPMAAGAAPPGSVPPGAVPPGPMAGGVPQTPGLPPMAKDIAQAAVAGSV